MSVPFVARTAFPKLEALPRSYYLGHHAAALKGIKQRLQTVDLIVECRDARIPITSINPLLADSLEGRRRMVVYTKSDLTPRTPHIEDVLARVQTTGPVRGVHFIVGSSQRALTPLLSSFRETALNALSLAGLQVLVVGMPNVGKSTLINSLRALGTGLGKAHKTGDQPGVTRKIVTNTKIFDGKEAGEANVYIKDTPGVFMPYVPDSEAMLKLALCSCVKDGLVPAITLADYLLYQLNSHKKSRLYRKYHAPTNDIVPLLEAIARKTGKLAKGGLPQLEGTANWFIQQWRTGQLGQFVLDDVNEENIQLAISSGLNQTGHMSLNRAKKLNAEIRARARESRYQERTST